MNRDSVVVKLGRIYQRVSEPLASLGLDAPLAAKNTKMQPIFLLASPRSGSTFALQVLTNRIDSIYLTNLWNVLYATPKLGYRLSTNLFNRPKKHISEFGFVSGLGGHAEGLKFWQYWTGQGLNESSAFLHGRALQLKHILDSVHADSGRPLICGYLPHAFCIEDLARVFPDAVFLRLRRNLLDTSLSLMAASIEPNFSLIPSGLPEEPLSRFQIAASKTVLINKKIDESLNSLTHFDLEYESLVSNAEYEMQQLVQKLRDEGSKVSLKVIESTMDSKSCFRASNYDVELRDQMQEALGWAKERYAYG